MEGWKSIKLASVLTVQNGYAFDSKAFGPLGMPLIRIRDLKSGTSTETNYSGEFDARYRVNSGDLLVGMDGEFACYEWKGRPALLNQRVCRLQGFGDSLIPRFFFYGINKHLKAIEDVTGFTTVKHLSSKQILDIDFFVPSKTEQRRIVAILDEAFDAIATAKANTEKNLRNAREVFASHLDALFAKLQAGLEQKRLEELCQLGRVITYGVIKLGDHIESGIPCLRTSNVRWLAIETDGMKSISQALSKEYSRTILRSGEVLVNVRGTLGGVAAVPKSMIGWNVSREVAVVPVDGDRLDPEFAAFWIGSRKSQEWLTGVKKGAAYTGINIEDLRNLPIPRPSMDAQKRTVDALRKTQDAATGLEEVHARKLAALDQLKKSLLHQGFTGQLTAKSSDRQLEAVA